jgi:hypothetical protein
VGDKRLVDFVGSLMEHDIDRSLVGFNHEAPPPYHQLKPLRGHVIVDTETQDLNLDGRILDNDLKAVPRAQSPLRKRSTTHADGGTSLGWGKCQLKSHLGTEHGTLDVRTPLRSRERSKS